LHIGIDFDNTLINYDALFYRCARERGWAPSDLPPTKAAVRAWLWRQPDGNTPWTELQGEVYGRRLAEAEPFPGLADFFKVCRRRGVRLAIISHKSTFPALGPKVNLREAALAWLAACGFFEPGAGGLSREQVYFEDSRAQKLARIGAQRCSHFIDDLPEVFADPAFPPGVAKLLFDPAGSAGGARPDILIFKSWAEIARYVEEAGL
jgi:hypothetical protein